jgi:sodium-dependent dicarboxylate transporter 2/3/5
LYLDILTGRNKRTLVILGLALAAGFAISSIHFTGLGQAGRLTLGIFTIAAILWMLEPFPLYVTSFIIMILNVVLLGLAGGPLGLGGTGYKMFLDPFFDPVVVLLLGGFTMATAVKKYGLDEVISRRILRRSGTDPKRVLLGIMVTSAFLSMWLSNTATAALMIAVAIPLIRTLPEGDRFGKAIILGIPFACNIGGMGTPIGTPPNAIAMGMLSEMGIELTFFQWMLRGIPVMVVLLVLSWLVLCRLFPPGTDRIELDVSPRQKLDKKPRFVLIVFAVVVVLWLTSGIHGIPSAVVSLLPLVVFFGIRMLDDNDLTRLGWGILFIVGGGLSLGVAMRESGLSQWLVEQLPLEGMGPFFIFLLFALATVALTTFISNSATANLLLPIVTGVAAISPGRSAVLVALASSAAMILPISTPPNAIAYGSGLIETRHMVKAGVIVSTIAAVLTSVYIYTIF